MRLVASDLVCDDAVAVGGGGFVVVAVADDDAIAAAAADNGAYIAQVWSRPEGRSFPVRRALQRPLAARWEFAADLRAHLARPPRQHSRQVRGHLLAPVPYARPPRSLEVVVAADGGDGGGGFAGRLLLDGVDRANWPGNRRWAVSPRVLSMRRLAR